MPNFQQKIIRHAEKQKNVTHTQEKGGNRNCFWGGLDLNLIDKDDKDVTSILNMLNELKKCLKD